MEKNVVPVRKIMVASPVKGKLPIFYFKNVIQYGMTKIPGVKLYYSTLEGPAIQVARNQIVQYARKQKVDELVMIDVDVDVPVEAFQRLLSHDVDIVCGLYSRRTMKTHWHVHPLNETEVENENGLLRVYQAAVGVCKIKMSVFDRLQETYPDRVGEMIEGGMQMERMVEFFPMELMGKNTSGGRLLAIKELLKKDTPNTDKIDAIIHAAHDRHPESNQFIGEDYGFCCLARNAGIPIYLDTHLVLKHEGTAMFPLETKDMMESLEHDTWRKDEIKEYSRSFWPKEFIEAGIPRNHCADVIQGVYDVPIEFAKGYTPVILDIGANIGAFCRWANDRWKGCHIHAYEPAAPNVELLKKTYGTIIKDNVFIYIHEKAVADSDTVVPIYARSADCGNYSLSNIGLPESPICGNVVTIDAATLPEADIIKIDTEGSELMIINRLKITKRLKAIVLEYHSYQDIDPITTYLLSKGFTAHEYSPSSEHRGILKFIRK